MWRMLMVVLIVLSSPVTAGAQDATQLWPEIGVFARVNESMRFYFIGTTVKENSASTEFEVGPNFDFYLRPLGHPKRFGGLRLDASKDRVLMLRVGYRFLHSFGEGSGDEHRAVIEATARYPLAAGLLVSLRGRTDLRFLDHENSWRLRSRLSIEKELTIGRVHLNPYLRNELYYDSRFDAWSRTEWIGGAAFPLRPFLELESYFSYQNDTGGDTNRQVAALGAVLNLYF